MIDWMKLACELDNMMLEPILGIQQYPSKAGWVMAGFIQASKGRYIKTIWLESLGRRFVFPRTRVASRAALSTSQLRLGVTVVEVLFAMFVVLFGLVGVAVLLPIAGRQANDSYSYTHGVSTMQNAHAEALAMESLEPSPVRPWWFQDDEYSTISTAGHGFRFPQYGQRRWYRDSASMRELMLFVKERQLPAPGPSVPHYSPVQLRLAEINGRAMGFCIDPLFCGTELDENWGNTGYVGNYDHRRHNAQGVFRRSRMPFFDEQTGLSGTTFVTSASLYLPKLMRVSFRGGKTNARGFTPPEALPLEKLVADQFVSSGGDLLMTKPEDKSFGSQRFFYGDNATGYSTANTKGRISWLATLTPSEQAASDSDPKDYRLSIVVLNNRSSYFAAAPPAITGDEVFSTTEKMCFATSTAATAPGVTQLVHLPFSYSGGTFQVKLWSDELTDTSIPVGTWVMLSRRIVKGNYNTTPGYFHTVGGYRDTKVIHRHRWYRVVGVDNATAWPRTVRLAGEPWDYPEMNAVMNPSFSYALFTPSPSNQARSVDELSAFPGTINGRVPNTTGTPPTVGVNFNDLATTVTIFSNVVAVYSRDIRIP